MATHPDKELGTTRPRSRWSAALHFPATRLLIAAVVVTIAFAAVQAIASLLTLSKLTRALLITPIAIPTIYAAYYAYVRLIEKRPITEFSTQGALKELATGTLIGFLLFTTTIAILTALGAYHLTATGDPSNIILPLTSAILAAVFEEILFRAILFRITEASLGTWLAMLISAAVFGFIHLINPHATLLGAIAIIFEAGLLLAAAYILTRRLWFPIGLHAAWNFTEGGLFGVTVSGIPAHGLLEGTLSGPDWLSGGTFGPEASIVAVVLCMIAAIGLTTRAVHANQIVPPFWRRSPHCA